MSLNINPSTLSSGSVSTSQPLSNLKTESKESSEERTIDGGSEFSGVSSFAMAMHLSELNLSSTSTQFAYYSDNSLAMRASSQLNFKTKTEEFRFDITLSAESLGLTKVDFADPTKPMSIQLTYAQSQLQVSRKISIQEVQTLRTPQDIFQDLVKGLREVFRDRGNKSVSYVLDSEAMQALAQSDPDLMAAFSQLIMVMAMINLMKKQGEDSNDYTIYVSGKGKPYLDIQEEIEGELVNQTHQFNITVMAPESGEAVELPSQDINTAETAQ